MRVRILIIDGLPVSALAAAIASCSAGPGVTTLLAGGANSPRQCAPWRALRRGVRPDLYGGQIAAVRDSDDLPAVRLVPRFDLR